MADTAHHTRCAVSGFGHKKTAARPPRTRRLKRWPGGLLRASPQTSGVERGTDQWKSFGPRPSPEVEGWPGTFAHAAGTRGNGMRVRGALRRGNAGTGTCAARGPHGSAGRCLPCPTRTTTPPCSRSGHGGTPIFGRACPGSDQSRFLARSRSPLGELTQVAACRSRSMSAVRSSQQLYSHSQRGYGHVRRCDISSPAAARVSWRRPD